MYDTDIDDEPMDIDSSATSYTPMEISYNEIVFQNHSLIEDPVKKITDSPVFMNTNSHKVKKFHIEIRAHTEKRKSNTFSSSTLFVLFFVGVLISVISFNGSYLKCSNGFNLKLLEDSLSFSVYGQSKAVETFIHALEVNASSKMLFLYGGTGVGKTLSVSIALENLLNYTNVYHYTMPSFVDKFATDLKLGFIFCEKSVIVVDDLYVDDKHIKPVIREIIDKNESLRKNVTIILVYNCDTIHNKFLKVCDKLFLTELQQIFHDVNASKYFIKYIPLTDESLKKCIENELKLRHISDVDVSKVMKNFNVSHDGCKGVYTKIKSLQIL